MEDEHDTLPNTGKAKKRPSTKKMVFEDNLLPLSSLGGEDNDESPQAKKLKRKKGKRSLYLTMIFFLQHETRA